MAHVPLYRTGEPPIHFSQLSPSRQALVRLFQVLNFGQLLNLIVLDGEPIFDPEPIAVVDLKLDSDESARPEIELIDFEVRAEVYRFFYHLDKIKSGRIQKIEIRSGIPFRISMELKMAGVSQ
jgi:hypothetical protein